MGILDLFKKTRYALKEDEVSQKMQNAVIPKKDASDIPRQKSNAKAAALPVSNAFVVESSFKMPPLFVLIGTVRKGLVRKGMNAVFNCEKLSVKDLQFQFKKIRQLSVNQKGSLEVETRLGLEIPDGTELKFYLKKDFSRLVKPKKKKAKKASKRDKWRLQKALAGFEKGLTHSAKETGLSDTTDDVLDDLARQ